MNQNLMTALLLCKDITSTDICIAVWQYLFKTIATSNLTLNYEFKGVDVVSLADIYLKEIVSWFGTIVQAMV